ncbi:probable cytochrome P450 28d1 [Anthonomus grandis grandis]|uniref:probable cytochrome P450 28d1 n=1 Tax=Anthonomus grandis grandis TaxID=2921223 RepID=UPI0021654D5F|nr:probable cytochrome P450 28d1 [Anthonomus grandis grandis]
MLLLFFGVLFVFLFLWIRFNLSYWERRGIPGPKPWPIVGNIWPHIIGKKTLGEVMKDIYKKYEGYPFVGIFRATKPVMLLRDPELVYRVLVKDFKSFRNNEMFIDKDTDPIFGRNPFILRDQEWKDTRQMLTPGMTSGKMKNMFSTIEVINKNFVKYIENHPTANTDGIETRALTKRLTLDNVAKAAFGIDGKSFESYNDISEFNKLVNKFMNPGTLGSIIFYLAQIFPWIFKIKCIKFVSQEVEKRLTEIISEVVAYRRKNNHKAHDYLQFLIDLSKEKNFGDVEITSHASTLFIDGYETSSLVLSFLLLNLARFPNYQEKIRKDIKKYEKENNGELTYEAIHEMPWLDACFYESLRFSPPVDISTKECTEPFEYTPTDPEFKKITTKFLPGDIVILPYGMLPNDEKIFPEANKFKAERMFERDSFQKATFTPFGSGPRACIGQRLGIMQVKLATAYIIKNFELSVSPKLKQPISYIPYSFLNEVDGGFWIKYKKIET